jgi:LPXTG-motif cell wall-anchored protein
VLSIDLTLVANASEVPSSQPLAFTGRDAGTIVGIAAALMVLGAGLTLAARRRRRARAAL